MMKVQDAILILIDLSRLDRSVQSVTSVSDSAPLKTGRSVAHSCICLLPAFAGYVSSDAVVSLWLYLQYWYGDGCCEALSYTTECRGTLLPCWETSVHNNSWTHLLSQAQLCRFALLSVVSHCPLSLIDSLCERISSTLCSDKNAHFSFFCITVRTRSSAVAGRLCDTSVSLNIFLSHSA